GSGRRARTADSSTASRRRPSRPPSGRRGRAWRRTRGRWVVAADLVTVAVRYGRAEHVPVAAHIGRVRAGGAVAGTSPNNPTDRCQDHGRATWLLPGAGFRG